VRATVLTAPGRVGLEQRPDPVVLEPTDAVVEVVAAAVCGSDLWWFRGDNAFDEPRRMGHEFVGRIVSVGSSVRLAPGDFVLSAFKFGDNTCPACRDGFTSNCAHGGYWGAVDGEGRELDGGQGERVRVPLADGTLVRVGATVTEELLPHLLALTDVMATGVHAARCAGVVPGADAVVIGDGAVGLMSVLSAARKGASRIILMGRHTARTDLGVEFGATDVVAERGDEGIARVRELTGGDGTHVVLEAVGHLPAYEQALGVVRDGGTISRVGVPQYTDGPVGRTLFIRNVTLTGGVAPVRSYIDELLPDVLSGAVDPGRVFDREMALDDIAEAYRAMDAREALKVLIRP